MLRAKLHRLQVTDADLHYEGSITLAQELTEAADMYENEEVAVWNVTRGTRFVTYAINGDNASDLTLPNQVIINGAAAHLAGSGDIVIVAAFNLMSEEMARAFKPKVVFVDGLNRVRSDNFSQQ
jgi:aspartate 1-decarboxylase